MVAGSSEEWVTGAFSFRGGQTEDGFVVVATSDTVSNGHTHTLVQTRKKGLAILNPEPTFQTERTTIRAGDLPSTHVAF